MAENNNGAYQRELFTRLKKSVSLKKEEESFGSYIKPVLWWIVEKPNPKLSDLLKVDQMWGGGGLVHLDFPL